MTCKQTLCGNAGIVYSISWSPPDPTSGRSFLLSGTSKGAVVVWDTDSGVKKQTLALYSPTVSVFRVAWNPSDIDVVLTAGGDGQVFVVSVGGGRVCVGYTVLCVVSRHCVLLWRLLLVVGLRMRWRVCHYTATAVTETASVTTSVGVALLLFLVSLCLTCCRGNV
jgi:WD40 repeat protein